MFESSHRHTPLKIWISVLKVKHIFHSPKPVVFWLCSDSLVPTPSCCCVIQFQTGPALPDSLELAALSDVPRMKWAALSSQPLAAVSQASTYLQREMHDPPHASLWDGVHQRLGWSRKPSNRWPPPRCCADTLEGKPEVSSQVRKGSRSDGNMPGVHFIAWV